MPRAESARWTMNWSVHQYQTAMIGAPKAMPVHGKSGSDIGFHMSKKPGPAVSTMTRQPPSSASPRIVTVDAPTIRTIACSRSV